MDTPVVPFKLRARRDGKAPSGEDKGEKLYVVLGGKAGWGGAPEADGGLSAVASNQPLLLCPYTRPPVNAHTQYMAPRTAACGIACLPIRWWLRSVVRAAHQRLSRAFRLLFMRRWAHFDLMTIVLDFWKRCTVVLLYCADVVRLLCIVDRLTRSKDYAAALGEVVGGLFLSKMEEAEGWELPAVITFTGGVAEHKLHPLQLRALLGGRFPTVTLEMGPCNAGLLGAALKAVA